MLRGDSKTVRIGFFCVFALFPEENPLVIFIPIRLLDAAEENRNQLRYVADQRQAQIDPAKLHLVQRARNAAGVQRLVCFFNHLCDVFGRCAKNTEIGMIVTAQNARVDAHVHCRKGIVTDLQRDACTRIRHDAAFFGISLEALLLLQRKYPADHFLIGRTNPRPLIFNRMNRCKVLIKRKTEFLFHLFHSFLYKNYRKLHIV